MPIPTTNDRSGPPPFPTAGALQQALVYSLLFGVDSRLLPGARLHEVRGREVLLTLPFSDERLLIVAIEEGDSLGLHALEGTLRMLNREATGPESPRAVLVVGGGEEARRALRKAGGFLGLRSRLRLFQVDPVAPRVWGTRRTFGADDHGKLLDQAVLRAGLDPMARAFPGITPAEVARLAHRDDPEDPDREEARLFWNVFRSRRPWVTFGLGGLIVVLFGLQTLWGGSEFTSTLFRMGASVPERVFAGEFYRLFSAAFLHIGPAHAVLNLWALAVFGPFLERVLGPYRYLVLYACSALFGSLASVLVRRAGLSAGASGAIWGLMVAGAVLAFRRESLLPEALRVHLRRTGWQPILVNTLYSFTARVDLWAHFGGGAAGGLLVGTGLLLKGLTRLSDPAPPRQPNGQEKGLAVLSGGLAVTLLACIALPIAIHRPWELRWPPREWETLPLPGTNAAVEVPRGLSPVRTAGAERTSNASAFVIGSLLSDPIAVSISIGRDASGATLADIKAELEKDPEREGLGAGGGASYALETEDGRAVLTRRLSRPGLTIATRVWKTGEIVVRTDSFELSKASTAWQGVATRIAKGIVLSR